ncbi:MAG: ribbon-helix-helix domain-containing protein, partial [Candidatus Saccharimonadales bacterium]
MWKLKMHASGFPLPPDLQQFVQNEIERGEYSTTGEVVCAGLTLLRERDRARATRLDELRAEVRVGLEEL